MSSRCHGFSKMRILKDIYRNYDIIVNFIVFYENIDNFQYFHFYIILF